MSSNGSEGNTGLECTECGRHFSAKRSLRRHTLKKHCLDKPIFRRSLAMIDQSLGGGTKINLPDENLEVTTAVDENHVTNNEYWADEFGAMTRTFARHALDSEYTRDANGSPTCKSLVLEANRALKYDERYYSIIIDLIEMHLRNALQPYNGGAIDTPVWLKEITLTNILTSLINGQLHAERIESWSRLITYFGLATYAISKKPHYTESMTQMLAHLLYVTQHDRARMGGWPDFIKWSLTN